MTQSLAAVVLAGGRARRLGGIDKPALAVHGRALLDGVLAACSEAEPVVVVGKPRPTFRPVRWVREVPPFAGPLAALATGLREVPDTAEVTAVLAADLPNLRSGTIARLRAELAGAAAGAAAGAQPAGAAVAGAVLVDDVGRPQWLCGVWRTAALRAAVAGAGDATGRPLQPTLASLRPALLPARDGEAFDVDTPEDLRALDRE